MTAKTEDRCAEEARLTMVLAVIKQELAVKGFLPA